MSANKHSSATAHYRPDPGRRGGGRLLLAAGPHEWQFDARAIEPVRAVALDGDAVRAKCEDDPRLGFELMRRFAHLATGRLQSTRLRLLDVYGTAHATPH
jgi:hypothetical protein